MPNTEKYLRSVLEWHQAGQQSVDFRKLNQIAKVNSRGLRLQNLHRWIRAIRIYSLHQGIYPQDFFR